MLTVGELLIIWNNLEGDNMPNNTPHEYYYLLAIDGRLHCGALIFQDRAQSDRHLQDLTRIKDLAKSINTRWAAEEIDDAQRDQEWVQWLEEADAFRIKWGDDLVLPDVWRAFYEAQERVGNGRTTLPPIHSPNAHPGTEPGVQHEVVPPGIYEVMQQTHEDQRGI